MSTTPLQKYKNLIPLMILFSLLPSPCSPNFINLICYDSSYQPVYLKSELNQCVYNTLLKEEFDSMRTMDAELVSDRLKIRKIYNYSIELEHETCSTNTFCYSVCFKGSCMKKEFGDKQWASVTKIGVYFMVILISTKMLVVLLLFMSVIMDLQKRENLFDMTTHLKKYILFPNNF